MNGSPTHHPSLSPSSELFHSSHREALPFQSSWFFGKVSGGGGAHFWTNMFICRLSCKKHIEAVFGQEKNTKFTKKCDLRPFVGNLNFLTKLGGGNSWNISKKIICFGRFPLSFFTTPTYFCAILISSLPQCPSLSPDPPPPRPQMLSVARRPNHRPPGAVLVFHQNTVFTVFLTEFSECSLIELSAFFGTGRFLIDRKVSPDPRRLILDVFIFSPIWLQGHLIKILHERESYTFQTFDFLNLIMNCLLS